MSEHSSHRLSENQRHWLGHVRACEGAGQTMVDYAREQSLDVKALYNARSRLRRQGLLGAPASGGLFRRAQVVSSVDDGVCRVRLANGVVVELAAGSEPRWVSQVLTAAAQLP